MNFRKIPTVLTPEEIIEKCFRRVRKVQVVDPDRLYRLRKLNAGKVQAFADTASSTLLKYVRAFPTIEALHPFYRELIDLGVDVDRLKVSLGRIQGIASTVSEIGRGKVKEIMKMRSQEEMMRAQREALGRMVSAVKRARDPLMVLSEAREFMRRLPEIDPKTPTVIIAGYPNVGKSSLTSALSTAKPEISTYPFTTKGVSVGVLEMGGRRVQVVDTPGMLDREPAERNEIERKASSALRNLPGVVLFLVDPTETCGYPIEMQLSLLQKLSEEFPRMRFFVVFTKSDMEEWTLPNVKEVKVDEERIAGWGVVSSKTREGIEELKRALSALLLDEP